MIQSRSVSTPPAKQIPWSRVANLCTRGSVIANDCHSTFVGKKRAFEDAAGNAISFPAASDSDCSPCLFVKLLADLRSLLLAGKSLEYHFAILCFLSRITRFLKFFSAGQSIEPIICGCFCRLAIRYRPQYSKKRLARSSGNVGI